MDCRVELDNYSGYINLDTFEEFHGKKIVVATIWTFLYSNHSNKAFNKYLEDFQVYKTKIYCNGYTHVTVYEQNVIDSV